MKRNKKGSMNKNILTTAYKYGDTLEMSTRLVSSEQSIVKLNADEYLVCSTGEVKKYSKNETGTRADSLKSVKRTMRDIRRLVANNFEGGNDQLWITLTYKKNMRDNAVMQEDIKNFIKKLRRKYGKLEYINVIEPQVRGAFHVHMLLKTADGSDLYIANNDLAKLWGKGFTKTKRLEQSDNVSAYLMAYLSDIDTNNIDNDFGKMDDENKKIAKGARLHLYHKDMNIFRSSKGIVKPKPIVGTKEEMFNKFGIDEDEQADFYANFELKSEKTGKSYLMENEFYSFKRMKMDKLKELDKKNSKDIKGDEFSG